MGLNEIGKENGSRFVAVIEGDSEPFCIPEGCGCGSWGTPNHGMPSRSGNNGFGLGACAGELETTADH